MHDCFVKRAVDFVQDLLLHSLRAPSKAPFLQLFSGMHFTAEFSHRKSQSISKFRRRCPPQRSSRAALLLHVAQAAQRRVGSGAAASDWRRVGAER